MLYNLVYISRSTQQMTSKDLDEILKTSRKNNPSSNITGMLVYKDGEFMQALEGKKEDVEELYQRISQDKRHGEILVLVRKEIPDRLFKDWSMGFKNISKEDEGLFDADSFFAEKASFQQGHTALNFLSSFYTN